MAFKYAATGTFSERKNGPIGIAERYLGGAFAGHGIEAANATSNSRVQVWNPVGPVNDATLASAAGWTLTDITGTAGTAAINANGIFQFDSGATNSGGYNGQYVPTTALGHFSMVGAPGAVSPSTFVPAGGSLAYNFRVALTSSAGGVLGTGDAAVFGLAISDAGLINGAGALTVAAGGCAMFYITSAGTYFITGGSGSSSTLVAATPAAADITTGYNTAKWNNYSFRYDRPPGSTTMESLKVYVNGVLKTTLTSFSSGALRLSFASVVGTVTDSLVVHTDQVVHAYTRPGFAR